MFVSAIGNVLEAKEMTFRERNIVCGVNYAVDVTDRGVWKGIDFYFGASYSFWYAYLVVKLVPGAQFDARYSFWDPLLISVPGIQSEIRYSYSTQ